jgi:hypothetical protein
LKENDNSGIGVHISVISLAEWYRHSLFQSVIFLPLSSLLIPLAPVRMFPAMVFIYSVYGFYVVDPLGLLCLSACSGPLILLPDALIGFVFSVPVSLIVVVYCGGLAPSTVFVASHFFGNLFLRLVVLSLHLLYGRHSMRYYSYFNNLRRTIYIPSRS